MNDSRRSLAALDQVWGVAILAALLVWAFLLGCTPMRDFDIWWHLKTGQLMIERRAVPQTDWLTYVDWDKPWIDLHWGFQLLVVGLYAVGGTKLLVLGKAAGLAATVAIGWLASGRELPAWMKGCIWLLPVICLSGRAMERPETLSLIFLGLWCWILAHVDRHPRLIWLLPLLQVVWVNCHALFVLGLVVGGAFLVDRALREFWGGRLGLAPIETRLRFKTLATASVLAFAASFVNPYFEEGALFPLVLYRKLSVDHAYYSLRIGEFQTPLALWRRLGFSNLYLLAELLMWLTTAASFVWLARERRISLMRLLLFAAFTHLAWQAARNTNLLALVSGIVCCANCAEALALRRHRLDSSVASTRRTGKSRQAAPESETSLSPARVLNPAVCGVLLALAVSVPTGLWAAFGREDKQFGLGEPEFWFAHSAAQFAGQPGMPERAFVVHIGQAAVYSFHNGPERRVFMDGRLEVATRETFERHERVRDMMNLDNLLYSPHAAWEELIRDEQGRLPTVILDSRYAREQINGLLLTPSWRLVFADPAAAVFLPVALADELKLPPASPQPLFYPPGTPGATAD